MLTPSDLSIVIAGADSSRSQAVRLSLKGAGVKEARVALSPQEVLAACKEGEPDAMFCVVTTSEPNDPGLAMIRFVRRYEKCPNRYIPIVAVSPMRDVQTVRAVINSGGHEYCALPADGETLVKKAMNAIFVGWAFVDHPSYVGPCRRRRAKPAYAGPERRANWSAAAGGARSSREEKAAGMMDTGKFSVL